MNFKTRSVGLILVGVVALSACAAPAPGAMSDKAMAKATPTAEMVMKDEMPTVEAMMAEPTDSQMVEVATATPEAMMQGEMPAWFSVPLTDVATGKTFMLADLKGKVLLVENIAIWCSTCLRQQQEVQAVHQALGDQPDLVSVTLDIDPNEKAEALKAYVAKNHFQGLYAVAPAEVAREIGHQLGDQFLNPPSAPMFVIDRRGQIHPLPFGVKNVQALADALMPFLDDEM